MSSDNAAAMQRIFFQAVAHDRAGRSAEAERLFNGLLALDPGNAQVGFTLSELLLRAGRPADARPLIERALLAHPQSAQLHRTAAETLRQLARYDEALAAADQAVSHDPHDHFALMIRSAIHHDRLDLTAALADAERALAVSPQHAEGHLRVAELHLLQGAYAKGWPEYLWTNRIAAARPAWPPGLKSRTDREWQGRAVAGTLVLVADQGFGDAIQFARYIAWAATKCRRIALACDGALLPLLASLDRDMQVFGDWAEAPEFAAWSFLSRLPALHRTRVDRIPPPAAIAVASDWQANIAGLCPAGARRVGLVWAGRSTHPNDINRSTSLATLAPITDRDGLFLVSLQQGAGQQQVAAYRGRAPLLDAGRLVRSFADTAAVIAALDLVITVDTAVAHLAGTMGRPVWIMLPYAPDWRWLLGRHDSPWYPSVRLFRQPAPRRWDMVVAEIAGTLSDRDGLA